MASDLGFCADATRVMTVTVSMPQRDGEFIVEWQIYNC